MGDASLKDMPVAHVVDDDPHVAALLARLLRDLGYQTEVFHLAKPALAAVLNSPPDLLVVDYLLPSMNGVELATEVKAHLRDFAPPIVMVSGSLEAVADEDRHLFAALVDKPFRLPALRAVLRECVPDGSSAGRAKRRISGAQPRPDVATPSVGDETRSGTDSE